MKLSTPLVISSSIILLCRARLVNITIDDKFGDPVTNRNITYLPVDAWHSDIQCGDCPAPPDETLLFRHTLTASAFDPMNDEKAPRTASIAFNGTAVYVRCALSHNISVWTSQISFFLDQAPVGSFVQVVAPISGYDRSVIVFSLTNLHKGEHTLTIQNGVANGTKSLLLLDAILYSHETGLHSDVKAIALATVVASVGVCLFASLTFLLSRRCTTNVETNDVETIEATQPQMSSGSPLSKDATRTPRAVSPDRIFPVLTLHSPMETSTAPSSLPAAIPRRASPSLSLLSTPSTPLHCPISINHTSLNQYMLHTAPSESSPGTTKAITFPFPPFDALSPLSDTCSLVNFAQFPPSQAANPIAHAAVELSVQPSAGILTTEPANRKLDSPPLAIDTTDLTPDVSQLHIETGCPVPREVEAVQTDLRIQESISALSGCFEAEEIMEVPRFSEHEGPLDSVNDPLGEYALYSSLGYGSPAEEAQSAIVGELGNPAALRLISPVSYTQQPQEALPLLLPNGIVDGILSLPLVTANVHASIVDVSARVTITQLYANPANATTVQTKYAFRVPPMAAVCSFRARSSSGAIVTDTWVRSEGGAATYLEISPKDLFVVSVGSIPSQGTIETAITYVISLLNDDNADEIRFQLPQYMGQSFSFLVEATQFSEDPKVNVCIDVQTAGSLGRVMSPSHGNAIKEERLSTEVHGTLGRSTRITYASELFLDKDFVVVIFADGLDSPRCFAELVPPSLGSSISTVAFHLTMVPKFSIPQMPSQQYLFVIDRSYSMTGARIETAKQTLAMLLKLLPVHNTKFNVLSFGAVVRMLSTQTLPYTEESVNSAVTHVQAMAADLGPGTDIRLALHQAFGFYDVSTPTAVFLLTDGEAYDADDVIADVQKAVQAAPLSAPLRVFVLGIGAEVSQALCEAIATVGDGVCLFATDAASIMGKCARLLQAGQKQYVRDVVVDWGLPLVDQQTPTVIQDMHAGTRITVHAILPVDGTPLLEFVKVQGRLSESDEPFQLILPVHFSHLSNSDDPKIPLLHNLAARNIMRDLNSSSVSRIGSLEGTMTRVTLSNLLCQYADSKDDEKNGMMQASPNLGSSLPIYDSTSNSSKPVSQSQPAHHRIYLPQFVGVHTTSQLPTTNLPPSSDNVLTTSLTAHVLSLINIQRFDGSFLLSAKLGAIVGWNTLYDYRRRGADSVVWATALAVTYLQKHAPGHKELWVKPADFLQNYGGFEDILRRAADVVC